MLGWKEVSILQIMLLKVHFGSIFTEALEPLGLPSPQSQPGTRNLGPQESQLPSVTLKLRGGDSGFLAFHICSKAGFNP